jgi:HAMP domain-containing protein
MFSLESKEILAAIRRSLETHVLPDVSEGFVQLQVLAAMKALEEVVDRLENGDPSARSNSRLEAGLKEIIANSGEASPEFSAQLTSLLDNLPEETDEPRDRTRALGQALSDLLSASQDPTRWEVVKLLQGEAGVTAGDDQRWQCPEAIASLQ